MCQVLVWLEYAREWPHGLVDDPERETRKQAVFSLSCLPHDQAVPELIEVARTHRNAEVRKRALCALGETTDCRALDLFEEIPRR